MNEEENDEDSNKIIDIYERVLALPIDPVTKKIFAITESKKHVYIGTYEVQEVEVDFLAEWIGKETDEAREHIKTYIQAYKNIKKLIRNNH